MLSQCWHVPISEILDGLKGSPFEDVPDTVALLINGRSWGEWGGQNETNSADDSNVTLLADHGRNGKYFPLKSKA